MISYLNTLEVLGVDIDRESQVDIILQSLPELFKEFGINYKMNKNIYTLSELMNELVVAKSILVKAGADTNMAKTSSSKPKSKARVVGRRRISPNKKVSKLPMRERRKQKTTPKENVSIVVRKVIGRGIVQNY